MLIAKILMKIMLGLKCCFSPYSAGLNELPFIYFLSLWIPSSSINFLDHVLSTLVAPTLPVPLSFFQASILVCGPK